MKKQSILLLAFAIPFLGIKVAASTPKNIILFSPKNKSVSIKPLVLFKGKTSTENQLFINGEPVELTEEGRFYTKKVLEKKHDYNYFNLTLKKDGKIVTLLKRKIFYDPPKNLAKNSNPRIEVQIHQDPKPPYGYSAVYSGEAAQYNSIHIRDKKIKLKDSGEFRHKVILDTEKKNDLNLTLNTHSGASVTLKQEITINTLKKKEKMYRFVPGDVLDIFVEENNEATETGVMIAPDGKIYTAFLKGVDASGKTARELQEDLEKELSKYFLYPIITILPKTNLGNSYTIVGQVQSPGKYPLNRSTTLSQAIFFANGFTKGSHLGKEIKLNSFQNSFVYRNKQRLDINFKDIFKNNSLSQDIPIQPHDIIFIGSNLEENQEIYLLGDNIAAKAIPYTKEITLVNILSTQKTFKSLRNLYILRGQKENVELLKVQFQKILKGKKQDITILPGDIIYFPVDKVAYIEKLKNDIMDAYVKTFIRASFETTTQ